MLSRTMCLRTTLRGGQRARFPVERWRVKTAPRVRCPAPGLGMPLVGSGVLRLAQQFRQLGDVGGDTPELVGRGSGFTRHSSATRTGVR